VPQGGLAGHQHPTPDEWADAAQDNPQLVDTEWCRSRSPALRVAQDLVPLKGSPRYLALSSLVRHAGHRWPLAPPCFLLQSLGFP
jgi:hypothetical protein